MAPPAADSSYGPDVERGYLSEIEARDKLIASLGAELSACKKAYRSAVSAYAICAEIKIDEAERAVALLHTTKEKTS